MSQDEFTEIGAAILDERFPDVDLALRRGRHIDREDNAWYAFLQAGSSVLEPLYRRFGCELVHKTDGYYYLLPVTEQLGRRQLSVSEMLVGQALALLYLDPRTLSSGGNVPRQEVLVHLASVMGADALLRAFNPKRKRFDERVAQETVRNRVSEALRKLAALGFVELLEGDQLRLRAALMRFAEPVRGLESPLEALQKLVAKGEVVLQVNEDDYSDTESEEALDNVADDEDGASPEPGPGFDSDFDDGLRPETREASEAPETDEDAEHADIDEDLEPDDEDLERADEGHDPEHDEAGEHADVDQGDVDEADAESEPPTSAPRSAPRAESPVDEEERRQASLHESLWESVASHDAAAEPSAFESEESLVAPEPDLGPEPA